MRTFLRQAGTLFTGTLLAQLINLLFYPFLTRTYSTAAFGEFALFLSTVSILGPVACLRFDVVVQAAPFAQRLAAHRLGVLLSGAVGLVTAIAWAILFPLPGTSGGPLVATLLGLATFLSGYTLSAQALLVKHERYRASALAQLVRTLATALPQVLLFFVLPSAWGLMIGFCIGLAAQSLMQVNRLRDIPSRRVGAARMAMLLRRYRLYPLYDLPSTLLAGAALFAGSYLVFDLFGAASAGLFALGLRLAALPLSVAASNLSEVYFQKASRAFEEGAEVWPWMRLNLRIAGLIAIVTAAAVLLFAHPAVDLYLGPEWSAVGDVLIALVPMMALRLISVSIGSTPQVLRRPQWSLACNVALLAVLLGCWVAERTVGLGFLPFLRLTSGASALVYCAYILLLIASARRHDQANSRRSSSTLG